MRSGTVVNGIASMTEGKLREALLSRKSVTKSFDLYVTNGVVFDIVLRDIETYEAPQYISFDGSRKDRICDIIIDIYYDATEYAEHTLKESLKDGASYVKLEIRGGVITDADYFFGKLI